MPLYPYFKQKRKTTKINIICDVCLFFITLMQSLTDILTASEMLNFNNPIQATEGSAVWGMEYQYSAFRRNATLREFDKIQLYVIIFFFIHGIEFQCNIINVRENNPSSPHK